MITYSEPKVYLISEPRLNWEHISQFFKENELSWTETNGSSSPGDALVEFAGRICYVSFGGKQGRKDNRSYLENILSSGHGSVLEHANYTFLVTKASRGFTHEMVRHRAGFAYSQESTHYIDYSPETGLINIPKKLDAFPELKQMFEGEALRSFAVYKIIYEKLKKSGVDKKRACSTARQILPTGIESKLVFTGNVRALRHMIEARANIHNVQEIREVAIQVYDIMKEKVPNCFMDMEKFEDTDGNESVRSKYRKV
jgi:thymidylate synthase (FAD)